MISIEAARQLLDFAGDTKTGVARISSAQAKAQMEGTVAIHNILEERRVAYLADEVGMGKTYVALGAFALFRHFNPKFRILVIAPKENIQQKWIKELRNFVRNNVRFADRRVKAVHQAPARSSVFCDNLMDLIRETALDPDRDFFSRLSSFSFGLPDDNTDIWKRKRDELTATLPWLKDDLFDLRSKDTFKENFARAVCCALPIFDLVIVDEAHNLKGGVASRTWRNRLLALAMGREPDGIQTPRDFRGYGPRARRVLMLSATPLEEDYHDVWNQLAVFGLQDVSPELNDASKDELEKKTALSQFLIRRVNQVNSNGNFLTKNQYRREWRGGGVDVHDKPLDMPDDRQQLVVALVQKKVSELLEDEQFNHSFQIGMLASFESFLQTAKLRVDDQSNFDDSEQTEDVEERQGIDVNAVNRLSRSYKEKFGQELPHPKMDALVQHLRTVFDTGEKALVFVRRVASVKELQQKLETEYNNWVVNKLRAGIPEDLIGKLDSLFDRYRQERLDRRKARVEQKQVVEGRDLELESEAEPIVPAIEDRGGSETFFAWFFRGEGPEGILSGAQLALRLNSPRFAVSSFFLDNWVASLLDVEPGLVFSTLVKVTQTAEADLQAQLESIAGTVVPIRRRNSHREMYLAFQFAALSILADLGGDLGDRASVVLHTLFSDSRVADRPVPLGDWLETATFFTELRRRPLLCRDLWPDEPQREYIARFRRTELRRELISSMCRLGHPLIDLWLTYANLTKRIETRAVERAEVDGRSLAAKFLDVLESQKRISGLTAWRELNEAATNFDLIVDTNVPLLWERSIEEVPTEIGKLLREQQPIGGMSGTINRTLVRQFRMPGYPLILITTDLLQEGEDLHLFCSRVYHYGISWMPSSMEQRIGRIDRVRSKTERGLMRPEVIPEGDHLLQVFYPYLRETIEVCQVERVFERLNRFMRLMHERFGASDDERDRKINLKFEVQRNRSELAPISEPLKSAFPVKPEFLRAPSRTLAVDPKSEQEIVKRFNNLRTLDTQLGVEWAASNSRNALLGTLSGTRRQSFTLLLHSIDGALVVRCISPVGHVDEAKNMDRISELSQTLKVRVAAVYDPRYKQYGLTSEGDVLLGSPSSDIARVGWLIETVAWAADRLEASLLDVDTDPESFRNDLEREVEFER